MKKYCKLVSVLLVLCFLFALIPGTTAGALEPIKEKVYTDVLNVTRNSFPHPVENVTFCNDKVLIYNSIISDKEYFVYSVDLGKTWKEYALEDLIGKFTFIPADEEQFSITSILQARDYYFIFIEGLNAAGDSVAYVIATSDGGELYVYEFIPSYYVYDIQPVGDDKYVFDGLFYDPAAEFTKENVYIYSGFGSSSLTGSLFYSKEDPIYFVGADKNGLFYYEYDKDYNITMCYSSDLSSKVSGKDVVPANFKKLPQNEPNGFWKIGENKYFCSGDTKSYIVTVGADKSLSYSDVNATANALLSKDINTCLDSNILFKYDYDTGNYLIDKMDDAGNVSSIGYVKNIVFDSPVYEVPYNSEKLLIGCHPETTFDDEGNTTDYAISLDVATPDFKEVTEFNIGDVIGTYQDGGETYFDQINQMVVGSDRIVFLAAQNYYVVELSDLFNALSVGDSYLRLYGKDRYATSLSVAEALKDVLQVSKFSNVIVASGTDFADALAGSYLASKKDAPILLVNPKSTRVQDNLIDFISSNLAQDGTIYILGGDGAVPNSFEDRLKDLAKSNGYVVERLAGRNRYITNLEILKEVNEVPQEILVASGSDFADALSASATGLPILLVNKNKITAEQREYLNSLGAKVNFKAIGGDSAVAKSIVDSLMEFDADATIERISGRNRYVTSVAVAENFNFANPGTAVLAYGNSFPDGLCGGVLANKLGAPLILTRQQNKAVASDYFKALGGPTDGYVFGGETLISEQQVFELMALS